ncbi:aconitase/homoaconitase [Moesziomyces antarcticus T-34]|uniref:Aconitase/homoaconitase n=1 Tax=Pseudozyma antarctica (strain T-34) TaxID=1151754 RepID=M9MGI7_PSEA3|nr:aconitase/homoaconitase [Moesziomyces antarcticus T-34]
MPRSPPHLPVLPAGFGTDSSYPPIPGSTRVTASQPRPSVVPAPAPLPRPSALSGPTYRPTGPPLPPLPPGALEQERRRHQSASYASSAIPPSSGLRPGQFVHAPTPPPPSSQSHFVGGFATPPPQHMQPSTSTSTMPAPGRVLPPPPAAPAPTSSHSHSQQLSNGMHNMSIGNSSAGSHQQHASAARRASANDVYGANSSSSQASGPPSLSAPLPDIAALASQRERARDDKQRIAWAKQIFKYVERNFADGTKISEPFLVKWTDDAIAIVQQSASAARPEPEALYLRGDLQASGAFPAYLPKNLKEAFNDFELSARMGWAPSWFRIGRDYEVLGDHARARDAYDRGVHAGDVGCIYRLGMANLLGQLEVGVNHARAIAMLRDAADKADVDTPQPAYIYGMLLAGEFAHVQIAPHLLAPAQAGGSVEDEARRRIQKAAWLGFAPAQYKCGWLFEYAQLGCAFDPLLSVQYYSLASQGGETEADMALSKWFLCGAEQFFEKNETLAYTFADKAARRGLASAEFALGYYHEVGVGTERNVDAARKWYTKAAAKDNADAKERLRALQAPQATGLSRHEHEAVMDDKLLELSRKRTMKMVEETAAGRRRHHRGYERGGRSEAAAAPTPNAASAPSAARPPAAVKPAASAPAPRPAATDYSAPAHAPASSVTPSNTSGTTYATASDDSKKAYNTFAEMGFAPQKPSKRDECMVM